MSRTDLEGYLRNDEPSLNTQLLRWFAKGDGDATSPNAPKLPALIKVEWRVEGGGSFEPIHTITLSAIPTSTVNLLNEVQEAVTNRLGPAPIGQIRTRGWGSGSSGSPGLSFTRTLAAAVMGHPDVSLLRAENLALRRQNEQLLNALVTSFQATTVQNSALAGHLTQLSTHRVASTAAADLSSPFAALAMYVLYENRDKIREFVREFLDKRSTGAQGETLGRQLRAMQHTPAVQEVDGLMDSLRVMLDAAQTDPVYRAGLLARMDDLPPEMQSALNAFGFQNLKSLGDTPTEQT